MGRRGDTLTTSDGLGISVNNIADLLGYVGSESVGDVMTLCRSDRVNRWAKFKPVVCDNPVIRHGETFSQTVPFAQGLVNTPLAIGVIGTGQGGGSADDYVTTYNIYGMKVPFMFSQTMQRIMTAIDNYPTNGKNWPASGMASAPWGRMLDFDGYNHAAYCPLWLTAKSIVWANQYQYFQGEWTDVENQGAVGMDGINDLVPTGKKFNLRIIIRKVGQSITEAVIDSDTELGDPDGFYEIMDTPISSAGTYQAYFCAYSAGLDASILFPSTDDFPNPYQFIVRDIIDPESNPWNRLEVDLADWSMGYGLSLNRQHWGGACINTSEGSYLELWSSGQIVLYVDVVNNGNQVINLVRSNIYFQFAYSGSSGLKRPSYQTYLSLEGGNFSLQTGANISVPASSRGVIAFVFSDIFYNGSSRYSVQEGHYYGNPDTIDMHYGNAVQFNIETLIQYTTDLAKVGKAYSNTSGLSWNAHD